MALPDNAIEALELTSRTFFDPIMRLPDRLQDAVGSAYLCMRSIDEIEDHPDLSAETKIALLEGIASGFAACGYTASPDSFDSLFESHQPDLPAVTLALGAYASLAPRDVCAWVGEATSIMAGKMAGWVSCGWQIESRDDLDRYTMDVAGRVGLLLSDLWQWFEGVESNRDNAVGFGRGLQSVNILRNRDEDLARGVDFFPPGWGPEHVMQYIHTQLDLADAYIADLPEGPSRKFCLGPYRLARATVDVIGAGRDKLSRAEVYELLNLSSS